MIKINRDIEYALMCLTVIARSDAALSAQETALATGSPASFVAKVLQKLTRAGILTSVQGVWGGYKLERPAESVTVAEIIEALHGSVGPVRCCPDQKGCSFAGDCTIHTGMRTLALSWNKMLASMTLREFCLHPDHTHGLELSHDLQSVKNPSEVRYAD